MAFIASTGYVEQPIQRVMGNDSTSTNTSITYVEKGQVILTDNTDGFYLPTKLHFVDFVTFTTMQAFPVGVALPSVDALGSTVLSSGTCQANAGSATTIKLADAESYIDNTLLNCYIEVTHPDGTTETKKITANAASGDTVTLDSALKIGATTSTTYKVLGVKCTVGDPGSTGKIMYKIEGTL